jgi:hypothetical protein
MITSIVLPVVIAIGTLIWFGIGGMRDLRDFFAALRTLKRDARDDGQVVDGQSAADPLRVPQGFPVVDASPKDPQQAVAPIR